MPVLILRPVAQREFGATVAHALSVPCRDSELLKSWKASRACRGQVPGLVPGLPGGNTVRSENKKADSAKAWGQQMDGCRGAQSGKIRMVPSDPLSSQTPAGMHGMSFVNKGTGRHLLCSPPLLLRRSGSTLQSPPASSSCSESTPRNGLSLTSNDCLFPGPH